MKTRLTIALLPISTLLLLAFTSAAEAANQTVSNLGDTGLASQLRQKITACQTGTSPGGTITFSVAAKSRSIQLKGLCP